jgi:hypothetical protein
MSREVLTSDRAYYVRTDGSDVNDGLSNSTSGAFATISKALDTVRVIDPSEYVVVVHLGTGKFKEDVTLPRHMGSNNMIISGSPTFGATVIENNTNPVTITSTVSDKWTLKDFEVRAVVTSSGASCIYTQAEGGATLTNVQFSSSFGHHVVAYYGANVIFSGNYRITGNTGAGSHHILCSYGSYVHLTNLTCSLVGARTWGSRFVAASQGGCIRADTFSYSGSATGTRWSAATNGTIYINSVSTTWFPGNLTGSAVSGGLYT